MERAEIDFKLTEIARLELNIFTLEARNNDAQDFHNVSVWQVRRALVAAFEAGQNATK